MFTLLAGTSARAELTVKRSRFICTLARADDQQAARREIATIKDEFPDARHNCSAFIVEGEAPNGPVRTHSSDDGEPSGTAGPPILEVLLGAGLVNVVAVVTRYFGGVLLGTGGLVRAYSEATQLAVAQARLCERLELQSIEVAVPAAVAGRFESEVHRRGWHVLDVAWGADLQINLALGADQLSEVAPLVAGLTRSPAVVRNLGSVMHEVPR